MVSIPLAGFHPIYGTVAITGAAPHHLVADGVVRSHRRTRAGDAHERGITPKTAPIGAGTTITGLGLPSIGAPTLVGTNGCCA